MYIYLLLKNIPQHMETGSWLPLLSIIAASCTDFMAAYTEFLIYMRQTG